MTDSLSIYHKTKQNNPNPVYRIVLNEILCVTFNAQQILDKR